jgi:hypothetical protein
MLIIGNFHSPRGPTNVLLDISLAILFYAHNYLKLFSVATLPLIPFNGNVLRECLQTYFSQGFHMSEEEKEMPILSARVKANIPGTMFSIDIPAAIKVAVKGITHAGKQTKIEFKAVEGVGTIILEGPDSEFKKLAELLKKGK